MEELLVRAFYEEGEHIKKINKNPTQCGKFTKINKNVFRTFIVPIALEYRKSDIYDNEKFPVILYFKHGMFDQYVRFGLYLKGEEHDERNDFYIRKNAKERDIEEYARESFSRFYENVKNKKR